MKQVKLTTTAKQSSQKLKSWSNMFTSSEQLCKWEGYQISSSMDKNV